MRKRSLAVIVMAAGGAASMMSSNVSAVLVLYQPVVTQVGDGPSGAALSSAGAMTTIQVYQSGVANQLAPVAQSTYNSSAATISSDLVNTGNAGTEGQLQNNPALADAAAAGLPYAGTAYVFSGGYAAADATAAVDGATANANRVVGSMIVTGTSVSGQAIGTSTSQASTYAASNIRGAEGDDTATNFWSAGTGTNSSPNLTAGYRYANNSTQLVASPGPVNVRSIQVRQGQLYGSSDTGTFVGIQILGNSTSPYGTAPTTSGQTATPVITTNASSSNSSPEAFLLMDDPKNAATPAGVPFNVAYIDDAASAGSATLPGIQKWVYSAAGGWSLAYTISDNVSVTSGLPQTGYWGLAGQLDTTTGSVLLYATADTPLTGSGQNKLEEFIDPLEGGTASGTDSSEIVLATAPANDVFRGVALAPVAVPEPTSLGLLSIGAMMLAGRRRRTSR